jgi:hypothetical protein
LERERDKTKAIVEDLIESEIGYLFTNDNESMNSYYQILEKAQNTEVDLANTRALLI